MKKSEVEALLKIDVDALDECLTNQAELFYHVAEMHAACVSRKDEVKLRLEQATAEIDQLIRNKAIKDEVKITEGAIEAKLLLTPRIQELTKEYHARKADVDSWLALKEAYQQRSFMLRELVAWKLGELQGLSVERSGRSAERSLVDSRSELASKKRKELWNENARAR